jgi:hypothetical protein
LNPWQRLISYSEETSGASGVDAARTFFIGSLLFASGITLLSACTGDVHERVVTTGNLSSVSEDVKNSTLLSDAEKREFADALLRTNLQPYGKTVSTILSQESAAERQDADAKAREDRAAADKAFALDKSIQIYPDTISIERGSIGSGAFAQDYPMKDADHFTFIAYNRGSKPIVAFTADATLSDEGGGKLFQGTIKSGSTIAPSGNAHLEASSGDPNVDAELVRRTPVEKTVLSYVIQQIWYADGSQITR